MNLILISICSVTGIGLICAVILVIASKVMNVEADGSFVEIRETLPGANCGACGYAGCDGYAEALLTGDVKTNLCTPGGDPVAHLLSEKLGLAYEDVIEKVAVVHCVGDRDAAADLLGYEGIKTCSAASLMYGGQKLCPNGCLGFGDCARACPEGAIRVTNGIACVMPALCTGCGICVATCPKNIISLHSDEIRVAVACSNHQKGAVVRRACKAGCIACRRCEKECPENAIHMDNDLAVIDYEKCTGCGRCAEVCPVQCIVSGNFHGANKQPTSA